MAGLITSKNIIVLAGAALVMSAGLTPGAYAQTSPADIPTDVMAVISRRSSCTEWSQKASDPEQIAQLDDIMKVLRSLKCFEVAIDETALRQKYAGNPDILRAFDATWVKVVKRLPVRIAVPPDTNR